MRDALPGDPEPGKKLESKHTSIIGVRRLARADAQKRGSASGALMVMMAAVVMTVMMVARGGEHRTG